MTNMTPTPITTATPSKPSPFEDFLRLVVLRLAMPRQIPSAGSNLHHAPQLGNGFAQSMSFQHRKIIRCCWSAKANAQRTWNRKTNQSGYPALIGPSPRATCQSVRAANHKDSPLIVAKHTRVRYGFGC
jgi:hypothetical protein